MAADWSTEEIEVTVAEYFAMLRAEIAGSPYTKTVHNERVRRLLNNRSKGSVEFKFQNISAVLVNHGQPYVRGYLPRQNYQRALESAVLEWLEGKNDLAAAVAASLLLNPPSPSTLPRFRDVLQSPPEPARAARQQREPRAIRVDFLRLDAENRRLGSQGEEFAFELEQRRLQDDERRPDLAKRVRWVSRDEGDGLGYDISSFEASGTKRLIEVKTTGAGKYFPFTLTRNELRCSQQHADRYRLYRLYDFGSRPGLYMLEGALDKRCELTATQFRASFSNVATRVDLT